MPSITEVEAAFENGGLAAMLKKDCEYHEQAPASPFEECWATAIWGVNDCVYHPCDEPNCDAHIADPPQGPHEGDWATKKANFDQCITNAENGLYGAH